MSIPKFTAWASLGNYGDYSYINRKYKYDYDNSVKIEPALQIENLEICDMRNCREQPCRYRCGSSPGNPSPMCEGTREVCDFECCRETVEYGWICYSRRGVTSCR
jgi:hypothetical protein